MRAEFAKAMLATANRNQRIVFLTGDLGYMALEDLQSFLGDRFINAGVAEQNMVSVAAGLAAKGFLPWVYSIAPFLVLRPYEQIRNDICFHKLPVKLVGNGGGYGYGIMGGSHHVLQDIGAMRLLPHMKVYLPIFQSDVEQAVAAMECEEGPSYLRLNLSVKVDCPIEAFGAWRRLVTGNGAVIIAAGTVVGEVLQVATANFPNTLDIWSVGIFPFGEFPDPLKRSIAKIRRVVIVEEHCAAGGLGEAMSTQLLALQIPNMKFKHIAAQGYPSGRYGSQKWHLQENAMAGANLVRALEEFLKS